MNQTINKTKDCCETEIKNDSGKNKGGFLSGLIYGIIPHSVCILFIIFSIIGATAGTVFFKKVLLVPYFFYILIALSVVFATISAMIYLKRSGALSANGIKRKWKYLSILYGTTVFINLFLFMVVFPYVANLDLRPAQAAIVGVKPTSIITIKVAIPCTGHAPLITGELKKIDGVGDIKFVPPDSFKINYDSAKTSESQILSLDVFNTYKAEIVK